MTLSTEDIFSTPMFLPYEENHMSENKVSKDRILLLLSQCSLNYTKLNGTTTTVCQVVLPNGFTVGMGESACVDPANYDQSLGEYYAKERALTDAENNLWKYEGYMLSMKLNPVE